jgi:hypothetical protein
MKRRDRVRRVLILCSHFLRNLAFYRAGWRRRVAIRKTQFWVTANGNFLDHCVLEWCKLFADDRGKHHWRKVVTDQDNFIAGLLNSVRLTAVEFEAYADEMRRYRDKFIAHLDLDEVMYIPKLRLARQCVTYLYEHVLANEDDGDFFPEAPLRAARFYQLFANEASGVYAE